MGSHMGSVLVSPFPLEANGNRNGVMDGQNQIPNVVKVGSVCRHTGKHTETSLFSLIGKGKGMAEGQSKESHPLPAPGSVLSEPDILIPNPTRFSKPLHRLDCQSATHLIVYELV